MEYLDIDGVMNDSTSLRSSGKCKVARWLDEIPTETPGLANLLAMTSTESKDQSHYKTGSEGLRVVRRLGLKVSMKTYLDHRATRCECFD